jgi:hypothetical protein
MPHHARSAAAVLLLACACACVARPHGCGAADWAFRRSYFSHESPPAAIRRARVPVSYAAYRPAVASPYPGFSVRGVTRFDRVLISSGGSFDSTVLRSNGFEVRP